MYRSAKVRIALSPAFLRDGSIPPPQKAVLLAIAGWSAKDGTATPTKAQLAGSAGISERKLWDYLAEMRGKYVEWDETQIGGHRRCVYRLLHPCTPCMVNTRTPMHTVHDGNEANIPCTPCMVDARSTILSRAPALINGKSKPPAKRKPNAHTNIVDHPEADAIAHHQKNGRPPTPNE